MEWYMSTQTPPPNRWVSSPADMYVSLSLTHRAASGEETNDIGVGGVEMAEVGYIPGIMSGRYSQHTTLWACAFGWLGMETG